MRYFVSLLLASLLLTGLSPHSSTARPDPPPTTDAWDEPKFAVSDIDPDLKGEADAVVRLDHRQVELTSLDDGRYRVHRAVTVFNADGRDEGTAVVREGEFRDIEYLKGWIRDVNGNVIRDLEDEDIRERSASGGSTMYTDSRYHVARLRHSQYPYTVEFEYEVEYDGYFALPSWRPQSSASVPVERAVFELHTKDVPTVRSVVKNGRIDESKTVDGKWTTRTWTKNMMPAVERPPRSKGWYHVAPALHLAPSKFEISGYEGGLTSWSDFGAWMSDLFANRQTLPPSLALEVDEVVADSDSDRQTIRRLYQMMQDRTRYISVQLGIGGWQPFDVEYVHERGYGDCKALTNYLWGMLRHAGIDATPALIYSGESPSPFLEDFPSHQFNHVILAVPTQRDTLWLEATSQTIPFAHVHRGIEDRPALLIRENGGTLVRTPATTASDNRLIRHTDATIKPNGHTIARLKAERTGLQIDNVRYQLAEATPKEIREWVRKTFSAPSIQVDSYHVDQVNQRRKEIETSATVRLPGYATAAGSRIFVPINLSALSLSVPPETSPDRTEPVRVASYPWADTDTTTFHIPDGYSIEALPGNVSVENEAGRAHATITDHGDGTVTYVRHIEMPYEELEASAYPAYRELVRAVARNEREQMVLVKQ